MRERESVRLCVLGDVGGGQRGRFSSYKMAISNAIHASTMDMMFNVSFDITQSNRDIFKKKSVSVWC